jgi:hypothetical protein
MTISAVARTALAGIPRSDADGSRIKVSAVRRDVTVICSRLTFIDIHARTCCGVPHSAHSYAVRVVMREASAKAVVREARRAPPPGGVGKTFAQQFSGPRAWLRACSPATRLT